jgi:uncharacterized protein (DUF58 family)
MSIWHRLQQFWFGRQRRWLEKRIPEASRYQLDNRSIFILPTRFGALYLLVSLLIFVIASNYQHTGLILVSYFLLVVFVIHLFSSYFNFASLHVSIGQITPVYAGTTAAVPFSILQQHSTRSAKGTLWINFMPHDPKEKKRYQAIELDEQTQHHNIRYFAQHRGVYPLPRMTLQCDYPLGLFRCWTHLQFTQTISVYPKPIAGNIQLEHIAQLNSDSQYDATYGIKNTQHDEFSELSSYQVGDPLHAVAWKHMAKTGVMLKKDFTGFSAQRGFLSLPVMQNVELALSHLAYQINQSHSDREIYGVFLPHITITPNNSEVHRTACLQALAEFPMRHNDRR